MFENTTEKPQKYFNDILMNEGFFSKKKFEIRFSGKFA